MRKITELRESINFSWKVRKYNAPLEVILTGVLFVPFYGLYILSFYKNYSGLLRSVLTLFLSSYFIVLSFAAIDYYILKKRINRFYIVVPGIFSKYKFINMKHPKKKLRETECPYRVSLFNMRSTELRENVTYKACTHSKIIKLLKDNPFYDIFFLQEPILLTKASLHKIVKKMKTQRCGKKEECKNCDWNKEEDRDFYGIIFKVRKKESLGKQLILK